MLRIERRAPGGSEPVDTLRLAFDDRKKSRLRVWSEMRREVGIFLPWGSVLRDGELLVANSGEVLVVRAAPEPLSEARSRDSHLITRAAYHLGNRHVPLQIEPGILRWQRDHVLDEMVEGLGLDVRAVEAPFEPEAGAYSGGGHSHSHREGELHTHARAHLHGDGHANVNVDEDGDADEYVDGYGDADGHEGRGGRPPHRHPRGSHK